MNNIYFNFRLPNNHSPHSGRIRPPKVGYKIYNSSINNKYINVIEDNKIVKKKKSIIYDIIFTPCVKMLESIQIINNKNIKQCKEILDFYYNLPLRNKLTVIA